MRFDDITQVHYSTLKLHTTATNKYDMECTAIEATYPYLLTNLVAYFHVKFHCKQLKCSSYFSSFYCRLRRGHMATLYFRGKQLDKTTAYSIIYPSENSVNSSEIVGFRILPSTPTDKIVMTVVSSSKFFQDIHCYWCYYLPIPARKANLRL